MATDYGGNFTNPESYAQRIADQTTFRARPATGPQHHTHTALELCKGLHVLGIWLLTNEDAKVLAGELLTTPHVIHHVGCTIYDACNFCNCGVI